MVSAGGAQAGVRGYVPKPTRRPRLVNFPVVSYTSGNCSHSGECGYKTGEFSLQIPTLATLLQKQKPRD